MEKTIILKLKKVAYSGKSVGEDIRVEIEMPGKSFRVDQRIKPGTTQEFNKEIGRFESNQLDFEASVLVKITEKDFIFSDTGKVNQNIIINTTTAAPQFFDFKVSVRERRRVFWKSTAVFTVTLEVQVSNEPIVHLKSYKSNNPKEDYNRFDDKISTTVSFWNDEFSKQDSPPSIPLDPNLVKAMVYIESRIGYALRNGDYDVMQVGYPDDPALHTLNSDGWISPRTGNVARENEWQAGDIKELDYGGQANSTTIEESLKWGVRWLYHKAQYIQDGKRFWRTWKEAVKGYGPSKGGYEDKVWKIYTEGIDPQGIKLWMIVLPLLLIPALIFSSWTALHQGTVYISFKDIPGTKDYRVVASIVNGLWFQNVQLAIKYSNARNWLALDKFEPIYINYIDIDQDVSAEILISGIYNTLHNNYLLKKENGKYRIVYNIGEYGDIDEAFSAGTIDFKQVNSNSKLEAVEYDIIPYSNAPDQLWASYYTYDSSDGMYKFYKKDKISILSKIIR